MPDGLRWMVVGLLILALAPAFAEQPLRVAVATNFAPSLQRLASIYRAGDTQEIQFSAGSTGKLYTQIVHGAPFDLFFAADADRPARLEAGGLVMPGSRVTYALGRLVLWQPGADQPPKLEQLSEGEGRLALANPELAPYGRAAREVLQAAGLWDVLQARLVTGENVAQAYQYARSGNARWAFVPLSLVRQAGDIPSESYRRLPADSHAPIEQQAVVLKTPAADRAAEFLAWCTQGAARALLQADGYLLPAGH